MNRLFLYLLLFLIITLNSCFTYVEKDLDINPKIVLHGFVSPQLDTTIVVLTNSVPLFTTNPLKIRFIVHATVEISEDNYHWVQLDFDKLFKVYFIPQAEFPIHEGKTYYIRASSHGFESVSSSCTVPFLRETNFNFILGEPCNIKHEQWYNKTHRHNQIEWTDYPGEDNYYTFMINSLHAWWKWEHDDEGNIYSSDTTYYYSYGLIYNENSKPYIYSDHGKDGKKLNEKLSYHYDFDGMEEPVICELQTDKHWYMFHKSVFDYGGEMQFFMLEPIQLYSNIRNGYGVFGAFVMREYPIIIDN